MWALMNGLKPSGDILMCFNPIKTNQEAKVADQVIKPLITDD